MKAEKAFDLLKQFYDSSKDETVLAKSHKRNLSKTTCNTTDENTISRFNQIKKDIEAIEKDLKFYNANVSL
jgi:hypothetical protein